MPRADTLRSSLFAIACILGPVLAHPQGWPTYGNDPGGQRFSTSTQITRANLQQLHPVWTLHTHALDTPRLGYWNASFEATPILNGSTLFLSTPFDVIFAVDARTGTQLWSFDPEVTDIHDDGLITSRGVAFWQSSTPLPAGQCSRRIFLGTIDARLLAVDADTGKPCSNFGASGTIDLRRNIHFQNVGYYSITSPPTIVGNVVIVGSSVGDNQQVDIESGLVRAFDATTGTLLWSFEPLPWASQNHPRTGAGNVWSIISTDPVLNLVYLPTSSASPDYYGGFRPGDNRDADSVVALDATTGKRIWAFQTVHHNLWDYDVPSEPLLFTFRNQTPAIAITTKTGQVFVLDRRTGTPLYPIEERRVPQSDVPGETSSPTQPISTLPSLAPLTLPPDSTTGWQRSPENAAFCREQISRLRYEGIYTPVSLQGSLHFPGNLGGVNWGGAALDPTTGILYANVNRQPFSMKLVPRFSLRYIYSEIEPTVRDFPIWLYIGGGIIILNILWQLIFRRRTLAHPFLPSLSAFIVGLVVAAISAITVIFPFQLQARHFGYELSPQHGAPYLIERNPINDHDSHPCIAPPWGALTAINLNTGQLAWQTPLGSDVPNAHTGSLTFGGPIVTASGLVFTAATNDAQLRAFDAATGTELWSAPLPASARSTPMTYTLDDRQYVVIAAGGHGQISGIRGDSLIAFALDPSAR